ncbi:MAG: cation diffusion facilitator family transporter [Salinivirgaceae bacterium]|jgi:cation diffusion facilitator family transporter|nr:cation diffusion facilitator family transporter [Salinivirgaceae bacterium]
MKFVNKTDENYTIIQGWVSILANTLLFGLKYWAGAATGSVALIADAWHSLTDTISSVIVIVSGKVSQMPADDDHPFGHGRADLISSVIIGVLLSFIGFEFIIESIAQLKGGEKVIFGKVAIIVTIISIIINEMLTQFAFWAGRKMDSPLLKADGWHHRTDALSSVVVLIGIFLGKYFWWIDGALGLIIAGMIFYAAYEILRDAINRLLGEIPDDELILKIHKITADLNFDVCPHHFHMHKYGNHIEMTFHILLAPELSLEQAHDQANLIEKDIRDKLDIEATIHMEPTNKPGLKNHLSKKK